MSKRELIDRLEEMPSQIPADDDDAWWARIIQDRIDAVKEINRLVKSRNKWGQRYNELLRTTKK
jgi:type IV secretory pathway ATPase VirB11/archaellum biosynthesis ATPase